MLTSTYHILHHGQRHKGGETYAPIVELLKDIAVLLVAAIAGLYAGQIGQGALQHMVIHLNVGRRLAQRSGYIGCQPR